MASKEIPLNWDVFVAKRRGLTRDLPPGKEQLNWVGGSATLIYGGSDAVLVDTLLTIDQNRALADWIGARRSPESLANFWSPRYPEQIPDRLVLADELRGNVIDLEGRELVAVELGHTDTYHTTCLQVPSVGLVVAGDAAYNDTHLYLAESNAQSRREWIAALDTIESFKPLAVIAGHKKPEKDDSPGIIEETRRYIRDFEGLAEVTTVARELYDRMLEIYPNRANPGALWASAQAVKGEKL